MRLNPQQIETLKHLTAEQFGSDAELRLFGSRIDDRARGGDVDLPVEVSVAVHQPALRAARLAARMSRALRGRRVDVLLAAPNLASLPIHRIAREQGRRLLPCPRTWPPGFGSLPASCGKNAGTWPTPTPACSPSPSRANAPRWTTTATTAPISPTSRFGRKARRTVPHF